MKNFGPVAVDKHDKLCENLCENHCEQSHEPRSPRPKLHWQEYPAERMLYDNDREKHRESLCEVSFDTLVIKCKLQVVSVALSKRGNSRESLRDKNADCTIRATRMPLTVYTAAYLEEYRIHTAPGVFVSAKLILCVLLRYLGVGCP